MPEPERNETQIDFNLNWNPAVGLCYDSLHLVTTHPTYLTLSIDSYDATAGVVHSGNEDGLPADTVHVDASARLQVVQVDVAKLGDEVDYVVLGAHLEGKGRLVL